MPVNYRNVRHQLLSQSNRVEFASQTAAPLASLEDPALKIVTDFREVKPFTIEQGATIDRANSSMISFGVRLLFITDNQHDLIGLITYNDLHGEKPLNYVHEHGGSYDQILVQDIMTPRHELEVFHLSDIERSHVGDVVETMKSLHRQHMLVTDVDKYGKETIVGLISTSRIGKMLDAGGASAEGGN